MIKRLCIHCLTLTLPLLLTAVFGPSMTIAATGHKTAGQTLGNTAAGVDGHWEGMLDREGAKMAVRFDFKTEGGKTSILFSSDSWMVMDWPVGALKYESPKLEFKLGGDSGDHTTFDGALNGTQSWDASWGVRARAAFRFDESRWSRLRTRQKTSCFTAAA
jgi:hypothetical protein